MTELANLYASLSLSLPSIPDVFQEQVRALIRSIDNYAAQQPGYDDMLESYLDALRTHFRADEAIYRKDFENPLVATIALYCLFGPTSWREVKSRARELRHF